MGCSDNFVLRNGGIMRSISRSAFRKDLALILCGAAGREVYVHDSVERARVSRHISSIPDPGSKEVPMAVTARELQFDAVFETLPDIVIQDSVRDRRFYVPAGELEKYSATAETWSHVGGDTVTFVIPDPSYLQELPPFVQAGTLEPSVLVQYPRGQKAYFLRWEDLKKYETAESAEALDAGVYFWLPSGVEVVEELPHVVRALLQTGLANPQ